MPKKRMVGLIAFTTLPDQGLVGIIQRRGEFNYETMKAESFPGGYQLTVWGGIDEGESPEEAMRREVEEEAGDYWMLQFWGLYTLPHETCCVLDEIDNEKEFCVIYGMIVEPGMLGLLRLGPASGGIRLIKESEIPQIRNLSDFERNIGVIDRSIIAAWDDAKEALIKGFQWAKNQTPKP